MSRFWYITTGDIIIMQTGFWTFYSTGARGAPLVVSRTNTHNNNTDLDYTKMEVICLNKATDIKQ